MVKLYLIIIALVAFIYGRPLLKYAPALLKRYAKNITLTLIGLLFLYLLVTGHFNWLLALIGLAIVWAWRLSAVFFYATDLHHLWSRFRPANRQQTAATSNAMSAEQAYQILGLTPTASKRDIIEAHRKLIQKNHPDRGGSAYLAAKINLAKKTLLPK